MLYQTQQKLKKKPSSSSGRHRKHGKSSASSTKAEEDDAASTHSSAQSVKTSNDDVKSAGPYNGVDSKELSHSLQKLKETAPSEIVVPTPVVSSNSPSDSRTSPSTKRLDSDKSPIATPNDASNDKHRSGSTYSTVSGSSVPSSLRKVFRRNSSMTSYQSYLLARSSPTATPPSVEVESMIPNRPLDLKQKRSSSSLVFAHVLSPSTKVDLSPTLPDYIPITDLSIMNSIELVNRSFLNPAFQIQRYQNFIEFLKDHHVSDPVNFASVRNHCLLKFIKEHLIAVDWHHSNEAQNFRDMHHYEAHLSFQLLRARNLVRRILRQVTAEDPNRSPMINCEELIQLNYINYVRYSFSLPSTLPSTETRLNEFQRAHYEYKECISNIQRSLELLKREELGSDIGTSGTQAILNMVTKVSYEFVLLEKYHIHILSKLNNNYLIESRSVRRIFEMYKAQVNDRNTRSPKVLLYNNFYSSQYTWHLSLSIPFARVYQMSICNEVPDFYVNYGTARNEQEYWNNEIDDENFYKSYLQHLSIEDFKTFQHYTPKNLVELVQDVRSKGDKSNGGADDLQPFNFQYYPLSLASIPSNTFDIIQSRDLALQLTPKNFKVVLGEFFRILKPGGSLELSVFQFGKGTLDHFSCEMYGDLDLTQLYDIIPHFITVVMQELVKLFGADNVSYSVALLNRNNEVTDFLMKHLGLVLYDIFGRIDDFCVNVRDSEVEEKLKPNTNLNQLVHIRAEKRTTS